MDDVYKKLTACLKQVRKKTDFIPNVALILGSGLGSFADSLYEKTFIEYKDISGFPVSTVTGHKGRFVFGYAGDVPVVIMQGRIHYYEGYSIDDVVLPARLMGLMGAKTLFLTNAAGGINTNFSAGDLMVIKDHISTFAPSPLRGKNYDELGVRFPDMTEVYSKKLRELIFEIAEEENIKVHDGVYMQVSGPQYETPAEIKMMRKLGADAVGMSTACEAIAAHHMGMQVCGISLITNMASGVSSKPLSHKEVTETAQEAANTFERLVSASIERMAIID
ncbi:MAG: purine-nucleoside phosphorylase [Clostridiales bacterium]|nr:MAG: purine-nucleoside phosphorylase [Clostridiales bacterium]